MLRRAWAAYERALGRRPYLTQACSSAVLWAAGDGLAQRIEHLEGRGSGSLDARRMALTSAFGFAFIGPAGEFWYKNLNRAATRAFPGAAAAAAGTAARMRFIAFKVAVDSLVMGSTYVAGFFAWQSLVIAREGVDGLVDKLRGDFWPTYAAELLVWPPVQFANFSLVPVRHQLLLVNVFSLADAAFISWAGSQRGWLDGVLARLGLGGSAAAEDTGAAAAAAAAAGGGRGGGDGGGSDKSTSKGS